MTSLVFLERDAGLRDRLVLLLSETMPDLTPLGQALDEAQLLAMCQTGHY